MASTILYSEPKASHFLSLASDPWTDLEGTDATIVVYVAALSLIVSLLWLSQDQIFFIAPKWLRPFAQEEEPLIKHHQPWARWTLCLIVLALSGLGFSVAGILQEPSLLGLLEIVPWLVICLITAFDRPARTPKLLFLQYLLVLFGYLTTLSTCFLDGSLKRDWFTQVKPVIVVLAILTIINMPIRDPSWCSDEVGNYGEQPSDSVRSPEDSLTLWQFWTMSWVHPLARVAKHRELLDGDVWQLPVEFQHTRLYMAFRELKGNLLPCLIEANGLDLSIATSLAIVEKVSEVSNIRLTSKLYRSLDHHDPSKAMFWCLVMLSIDTIRQVSKTCAGWYSRKAYERSRGEAFIALFGKLLTRAVPGSETAEKAPVDEAANLEDIDRRGAAARIFGKFCGRIKKKAPAEIKQNQLASNAKIVNLVRGDTYEISQRFWDFSKLVSQPVKVVFTVYYLIDIMGWSSCLGFALMVLFLTCNSFLVKLVIKLERQRTVYSDRRAQSVAHFVEASRALKLNGWTSFWSSRIMTFRASEMAKRLQISLVSAAISTVNVAGGAAYPFASIWLYAMFLRQGLPNDVIWPSLQLFGHLEASAKEAFDLISAYWKATIPIERVNKYMSEPDRDMQDPSSTKFDSYDVVFRGASFSRPSTDALVLKNLTLQFGNGLTVIRGKVGCGKSSLLLAALNEMELREGDFSKPDKPIAYAQQLPWLQSKTIQENILFTRRLNPTRYREVIHACALAQDLAMFPEGDLTKLEEGGIGLSGGQKARVALARAVYSEARILLLDDPLSALDHDTAKTIVERFLLGPLARDRTIVMATHRDELVLRHATQVIDMINGRAHVLSPAELEEELEHPHHAGSKDHAASGAIVDHDGKLDEVIGAKEAPETMAEIGGVPLSIYTKYMRAGGLVLWFCLAFFYGLSRVCDVGRARLLEAWGRESAPSYHVDTSAFWSLPNPGQHPKPWLFALAGLSATQVLSYMAAQILLAHISINAANGLFKIAIDHVSNANFRYYDMTPTGQLKNRLISDMGMVDGGILAPLEAFIFNLIVLTLSLFAIMSHQPFLLIILIGVSLLFVRFFIIYVPISRSLRRNEMRYLTPIISNIGVMQDGLVTIRAMRVEQHFQDKHLGAVDDFQKQDHFFWSMAFWLDFRLGMTSACMRSVLILSMIWYGTPASAVGFVLTQTTIAMSAVQQLCEKFAALQLDAVSLERVEALNRIPEEPTGDIIPPEDWPRPSDSVKFENVSFKYAPGLPSVLDNVSFEIPGGSTCAILGRTGSGKSTIANTLLATEAPFLGRVRVGSIDLARVNRKILRNRITFIQQDPILFPGTLRDNIDPEGRFSDEACINAIHRVLGNGWNLNSTIDAGGKNLSQGQRQLVGIGRAVLRRSGLVILDEATASIDRGTAARVQKILREELSKSTVLTIAHRLEAVEDANWCLRLDHGKVVECGPAGDLAARK